LTFNEAATARVGIDSAPVGQVTFVGPLAAWTTVDRMLTMKFRNTS
jgi:hypothetical protein